MKKLISNLVPIFVLILFAVSSVVVAGEKTTEANVWTTKDGAKHFKCPVMGSEGVVKESTTFSIVDGKKYYHCCGGCSGKFTENTAKYLDGFVTPANVVKIDDKGKHFQCVVSGESGVVGEKTKYSDKDGKRYYFCCNDCKKAFDKKAEKFIKSDKKKS
jgi:YHS domain-containing protein